jgi:hypothetical protein
LPGVFLGVHTVLAFASDLVLPIDANPADFVTLTLLALSIHSFSFHLLSSKHEHIAITCIGWPPAKAVVEVTHDDLQVSSQAAKQVERQAGMQLASK